MKAILLSGGVDSTALAFLLKPELAITIDYGQRASVAEMSAAAQISCELGIKHEIISIDCSAIARGDMSSHQLHSTRSAYCEWWPFRNQLLATFAAAHLIDREEVELIFGSVSSDFVHADGRAAFFNGLNALFQAQEGQVVVKTPALHMTTEQLILESKVPSGLLSWSFSCHRGNNACGLCRGCLKRRQALVSTGLQL